MVDFLKRSWAVIHLDHLAYNVASLQKSLRPGCMMMGIVKADAYGHGDRYIAKELAELGINWFGVSNLEEALSLRAQGLSQPILILGFTPSALVHKLVAYNITQTVFSSDYALELSEQAVKQGVRIPVHIKLDTGMHRIGFNCSCFEQAVQEVEQVCSLSGLSPEGIFTHFAVADEAVPDSEQYTRRQFEEFCEVIEALKKRGISFPLHHCCNSAATIRFPEMQMDMVRVGIWMYGLDPSEDCRSLLDIKPVMEIKSAVSMVKELSDGESISYGRRYRCDGTRTVATVPIGYADGYSRVLSGKGRMLVHGSYAPVAGSVCMDQLVLDVTGIPDVCAGDVITVVGEENGLRISFDELAKHLGTINYELACLISKRIPRVYSKNGVLTGAIDYVRALSGVDAE